jgi:outer membrane protein assembly factor BamD
MTMRFLSITFLTFFLLTSLLGCGPKSEVDLTADWSAEKFYLEARAELEDGNYLTAIEYYETLESRFPFGKYAMQAQIDVAYAYFKFDEPDSAITAIDRFIKLHPRHADVDYAYYLKGLVNFERGGNILDVISDRDISDFDRNLILRAFNDFKLLIQRFPESKYATDARKRMIYLRNELARADFKIASYYASRDAWVAVTGRTHFILQNYQGTSVIKRTLELQLKAYQKLDLQQLANDTQRIIDLNYGKSS